ncbi:MAG: ABC transporter permease [Chloroflexi bacterium]|nr:ABC transporter permease [Chloroflexota bacterium]
MSQPDQVIGKLPLQPAFRAKERSLWSDALRKLVRNRLSLVGLFIFCLLIFTAIFGPYIAPYDYITQDLARVRELPSADHWLGTDELGRDFLSRVVWGARTAVIVAFLSTGMSLTLGLMLGAVSAYMGGWAEFLVSRLTDVAMAVPDVLLAVLVATTFREPVAQWTEQMYALTHFPLFAESTYIDYIVVFGALSLVSWPGYARLVRGQILSLRKKEFVEAAIMVGLNSRQVILRYLLPNALGPIVVAVTFSLAGAMVLESSLSFLGVGVQPPQASWGSMINDNMFSWRFRPWLTVVPAVVLGVVSLGINFLGDGLNDALNPRQSQK